MGQGGQTCCAAPPGEDVAAPGGEVVGSVPITREERIQVQVLSCALTWDTGGGKLATVYAMRKPLGLRFGRKMPITVVEMNECYAKEMGIGVGWILMEINGVDITNMTFTDADGLLHTELVKLPGSIPLKWDTGKGVETVVYATMKPLGITFEKGVLPVTIANDPYGHGKDIGIRAGWVLKCINYIDISRDITYAEAENIIRREISELPLTTGTPSCALTWDTSAPNGGQITVSATKRPLGLTYDRCMPIRIEAVQEHARDLGIKAGWVLTAINGTGITGMEFAEADNLLRTELAKLPGAIPLKWEVGDWKHEVINWATKQPLGVTFAKDKLPITITDVPAGHARDLGIKAGWVLKSVNNIEMSKSLTYAEAEDIFRREIKTLPGLLDSVQGSD